MPRCVPETLQENNWASRAMRLRSRAASHLARFTTRFSLTSALHRQCVCESARSPSARYSRRIMLPAPRHRYSFEEYLETEEIAGVRHEFFDGEIYAMAGGTPEHAAMAAAVTTILGRQLGSGPCRVYSSDLRVRVAATGLATYPDVTVVCGRSERDANSSTHVTNPKILVEVLSPATAEYDRGEKLEHYRQIPSLEAVVLIDHEVPKIELWTREPNGWVERRFSVGEVVPLDPIRCALPVQRSVRSRARRLNIAGPSGRATRISTPRTLPIAGGHKPQRLPSSARLASSRRRVYDSTHGTAQVNVSRTSGSRAATAAREATRRIE